MTNMHEKKTRARANLEYAQMLLEDAGRALAGVLREARQALRDDEAEVVEDVMLDAQKGAENINYLGGLWRLNHDGRGGENR